MESGKVVALFLKYDYGIAERGPSGERQIILPALQKVYGSVSVFWMEENGFPFNINELQRKALRFVENENPSIVFLMLMKDEIKIETIDTIAKKCIVVNWFCDDQWRFDGYTKSVAPHLSWSITTDKYALPKYAAIGCQNVILSQWAAPIYIPNLVAGSDTYEYEVSFVGGANATREWIVKELARRGINVACFGAGWNNGRVSLEQMREIFHKSKINLNLSNSVPKDSSYRTFLVSNLLKSIIGLYGRRYNGYLRSLRKALGYIYLYFTYAKRSEALKARVFEIAGSCGFQLSQFCLEIEDYFVPGREIVLYSSVDELATLVRYYLDRDREREAICQASYVRAAGYTYEDRFSDAKRKIEHEKSDLFGF